MRALLVLILFAGPAAADTLVAARTIRALTVIAPEDLARGDGPGLTDLADVVGQEARVTLYAGRPIRPGDIGPPAVVERNGRLDLLFAAGGLSIRAEGRALDRGGAGDVIRVMNTASRSIVTVRLSADGRAHVGE
ncbi:MAG TPA: flagellar basal body P-ring formation chaperone FlgA [Paracoccaceae bacterium]|nr:flagellar basal body P-ring formation chaperone FlgA [Paracoccaceae bacterium]